MKKIIINIYLFFFATILCAQVETINEPLKTITKKGSSIMALQFSNDSKKLAVGSSDGKVILYNYLLGEELMVLTGHNGIITSIQFSKDDNYLLTTSKDKTLRYYDLKSGLLLFQLKGHENTVTSASINESTGEIISMSTDRCIRFWNKSDGGLVKQLPSQPKELNSFVQTASNQYFYIGSSDFSIRQMEVPTGKYVREVAKHTSIIRTIKMTADEKSLFVTGDDPSITIVNLVEGTSSKKMTSHKGLIAAFDLSGDDTYLATGATDKQIKIWNAATGNEVLNFPKQSEIITALKFSPDGKYFATSDLTDKVQIWDIGQLKIGLNKHQAVLSTSSKANSTPDTKSREDDTKLTKVATNTSSSQTMDLDFDPAKAVNNGKYYALIIAVQDYLDPTINDLDKPARDAQQIVNTLNMYYTFDKENTTFLTNPKRDDIVKAFDALSKKVTEFDNLLIFYAGHGVWDEQFKKGYWLPADAEKDNRAYWFSNSDLKDYIGGIKSKHTLLVADACFSGGIFKTRDAFANASKSIKQFYELPSRKAMTSGALKTVPDESVFIRYMIKRLQENQEPFLSSESLFSSFRQAVINNSPNGQVPQYGEIKETGDEGGDFIFIKRR